MIEPVFLFLDFDGVLHRVGSEVFDPEYVGNLESVVVDHPEVCIVVTSSWREVHSIDNLREFLGPNLANRVVGTTPVIDDPFLKFCRYRECLAFLDEIGASGARWVAVDDEAGNFPPDAPVIFTNPRAAFTSEVAERLRIILREFSLPSHK